MKIIIQFFFLTFIFSQGGSLLPYSGMYFEEGFTIFDYYSSDKEDGDKKELMEKNIMSMKGKEFKDEGR